MARRKIMLKVQNSRYEEGRLSGVVKPGYLGTQDSAGNYKAHNLNGGAAEHIIFIEDALQGRTIDDAYASGELGMFYVGVPGDEFQMVLKAGENVAINDSLSSAGNGQLKKATAGEWIVAKAQEALDLSAETDPAFIPVRLVSTHAPAGTIAQAPMGQGRASRKSESNLTPSS